MNIYDFLIIAIVIGWIAISITVFKKRKKSGKCIGCSGNCAGCSGCHIQKGGADRP